MTNSAINETCGGTVWKEKSPLQPPDSCWRPDLMFSVLVSGTCHWLRSKKLSEGDAAVCSLPPSGQGCELQICQHGQWPSDFSATVEKNQSVMGNKSVNTHTLVLAESHTCVARCGPAVPPSIEARPFPRISLRCHRQSWLSGALAGSQLLYWPC